MTGKRHWSFQRPGPARGDVQEQIPAVCKFSLGSSKLLDLFLWASGAGDPWRWPATRYFFTPPQSRLQQLTESPRTINATTRRSPWISSR